MRIPLAILAIVALTLALFWWLAPAPDPALQQPRSDLPWQVQPLPDGSSRVFELQLGTATLQDAVSKFGPVEDMAVFAAQDGRYALEAYFGKVQFGPLSARVVTALDVPDAELEALVDRASEREGSPTGDWKFKLSAADRAAQGMRRLRAITYIPAYGGLEADFFRQRLGEPAAWKPLEEGTVQWFYPERGLSLVLNAEGKEVLEYVAPRDFRLPEGAQRSAPD
jgi:hypothetical protein